MASLAPSLTGVRPSKPRYRVLLGTCRHRSETLVPPRGSSIEKHVHLMHDWLGRAISGGEGFVRGDTRVRLGANEPMRGMCLNRHADRDCRFAPCPQTPLCTPRGLLRKARCRPNQRHRRFAPVRRTRRAKPGSCRPERDARVLLYRGRLGLLSGPPHAVGDLGQEQALMKVESGRLRSDTEGSPGGWYPESATVKRCPRRVVSTSQRNFMPLASARTTTC